MVDDPELIQDDQNPEWTREDFAKAKPFKEMFPEQFKSWKGARNAFVLDHEREVSDEARRVHLDFTLAADVVEGIKATGPGYVARLERLLREALALGKL